MRVSGDVDLRVGVGLNIEAIGGIAGGVRISGDIDHESVGRLWEVLLDLFLCTPIVVDAAGIDSFDACALAPFLTVASHTEGDPVVVIRNPSRSMRRTLNVAVPDGYPGLWIEFTGAGPGAAHRLTELLRSTRELHAATGTVWERAASSILAARRAQAVHAELRHAVSAA